jgi:hypothetical protein
MSSDNFYVVRKHPNGGFTYVMGLASHDIDENGTFNYDLPVRKGDPVFNNFDDGVFTHPECEDEEVNVKGWEGTE